MCNNTSNICNICNATCEVDTLQGVGYSVLFLLGMLVNVAALRAFIAKWKSWTDTHIYMFNLAIADSTLIFFLPLRIYDAFYCLPKTLLCTFLINIHFINIYASILTTAAISVQRYLTIFFPLRAKSWRKKKEAALVVCLTLWGLVVTICAVYRQDNYPDKLWSCYERCKNHPLQLQFLVVLICLGFLIPLLIVLLCSGQIIFLLLKKDEERSKSEDRKNVIGIVTANMIVFIVCFTPIHVGFVINYFYSPPTDWQYSYVPSYVYFTVSEWIASANCCFDSISYYFLLTEFYL